MKGESQGATLNSGIFLSLEDCAKECRNNEKCKSFEHNIFDNHCTLNSAERPNSPQKREYVFCSKIGKSTQHFNAYHSIMNFYSHQNLQNKYISFFLFSTIKISRLRMETLHQNEQMFN